MARTQDGPGGDKGGVSGQGDEQMKIEQGMSKEEGRGLSEEMATKKREKTQRAL